MVRPDTENTEQERIVKEVHYHESNITKDTETLLTPLRKLPYYAIRTYGNAGETLGSIKVDEHMAVLDKEGKVIPGVFAAGLITNGHQKQTHNQDDTTGSAMGFAVNSGCIAGRSALKFISGK